MKPEIKVYSKFLTSFVLALTTLSFCPAQAACQKSEDIAHQLYRLEQRVSLLEAVSTICGPITLSEVQLGNQKTFLSVQPGQTVECSIHYKLDASQQQFLDKHHLVVGISESSAQACIAHLYGVWNSEGTKKFNLTAPLQDGDYEVKVAYYADNTCEGAIHQWNILNQDPPSRTTTIGIIRVRSLF